MVPQCCTQPPATETGQQSKLSCRLSSSIALVCLSYLQESLFSVFIGNYPTQHVFSISPQFLTIIRSRFSWSHAADVRCHCRQDQGGGGALESRFGTLLLTIESDKYQSLCCQEPKWMLWTLTGAPLLYGLLTTDKRMYVPCGAVLPLFLISLYACRLPKRCSSIVVISF